MLSFKKFLQDNMKEEKSDIKKTLSKIPHSHSYLVKDYDWEFHTGNTLNGDDEHIGYIDDKRKEIAVSGPWNYGREFTILHEVGHKVWEKFILPNKKLVEKWKKIVNQIFLNQNGIEENLNRG